MKAIPVGRNTVGSLGIILGGMTWIAAGIALAFRPAGHPPHSFRHTVDLMPWLAAGLLLIGTSLALLLANKRYGRLLFTASLLTLTGSSIYALGRTLRLLFLEGIGWEPLLPLGHLLTAGGLALAGLAAIRRKVLPRSTGIQMTVSGLCLLGFNDQYLPVMAIGFGACVVSWSSRLLFYPPALLLPIVSSDTKETTGEDSNAQHTPGEEP